jgi:CheY-like chemotaxis protein
MTPSNQTPRAGGAAPFRPASYLLIADTDADRIARTVRECAEAAPMPVMIARDGDDAIRMLSQFGPPRLLIAALSLPVRDGLSVIDALRRIDDSTGVIAWATDRELREYATYRLGSSHAKLLGPAVSPAVLRRCVDSMLLPRDRAEGEEDARSGDSDRVEENWSDLAARAQRQLGVAGAAVYSRTGGLDGGYRLSVVWTSDAPMPAMPELLPSVLEDIIAGGAARVWSDLADEPRLRAAGLTLSETVRSLAIVPIHRDGENAGALCAFDSRPQALREADLGTMSAIASGTVLAHTAGRRGAAPPPIDRDVARVVIPRELARVRREQLSLSVVLFAAMPRLAHGTELPSPASPPVGEMLAQAVRGNDLVVRWTESEVLLVLTGVAGGVARRIAERVRATVETNAANRVVVSGAVTELRTSDSFEATVARAAERLHSAVQDGRPRIA